MRWFYIFIIGFYSFSSTAQTENTLSLEKVLWYIESYHPIGKKADLLSDKVEFNNLKARGKFDPKLYGNFDQKAFEETDYHRILRGGLKIPTWFGADIKAGFSKNSGVFLNPQDKTPETGLWALGASIPLGQGLLIDKRRAAIKKATLFAASTEAERAIIINNLRFDAIKAYLKWTQYQEQLEILSTNILLAKQRFTSVKQSFILGDKPAIDTLESYINIQTRQLEYDQTNLLYQQARLELSNYIWYEGNTPLEIEPTTKAQTILSLSQYIDAFAFNTSRGDTLLHPALQLYDYKIASLEVDQELKKDALKPTLNINGNLLSQNVGSGSDVGNFGIENYKWGANFEMPIFNRKERADLSLTKLKIEQTQLELANKSLELSTKTNQYKVEQIQLTSMLNTYTNAVNNYQLLVKGEQTKFDLGESSVFLINSRESKLIDTQLKLIELQTKYQKSIIGRIWSLGLPLF